MGIAREHPLLRRRRGCLALLLGTALAVLAPSATAGAAGGCPNEAAREQQASTYLPDCRGYELVSPTLKNGEEVQPGIVVIRQVPFQAATSGAGTVYETDGGLPESLSGGIQPAYLSSSPAAGSAWQNFSLNPDSSLGLLAQGQSRNTGEFLYYSPTLSCGFELSNLPLAGALPAGESEEEGLYNLYQWDRASNAYTLVTNVKPAVTQATGQFTVMGATADCSHVIFEATNRFLGAPEHSLYEWSAGTLRLASVRPDGTPAPLSGTPLFGDFQLHQMSSDGSRTFFTAAPDAGPDVGTEAVFLRSGGSTTEVSAPSGGAAPKDTGAKFQAASADGGHVFFTANYGLAPASSTGPASCLLKAGTGCDLYDYDVETKQLTDVSADSNSEDTEGADVRGVTGISEDGSYVYFSAAGQLVPGKGATEANNKLKGEANLYVAHAGQLSYIATIGESEAGASGGVEKGGPELEEDAVASSGGHGMQRWTARVSSDGRYLLFSTRKQITSYDNVDAHTKEPDFEDYEYSLGAGTVTCVSCHPDGSPPVEASKAPFGALGPYSEVRDLAIPRRLLDDGRVFFAAYGSNFVSQAHAETLHIYEWQPPGNGACTQAAGCVSLLDGGSDPSASYFEGASADGESVYVSSDGQLAPQDRDGLRDLYDVRAGGGILATPEPPRCSGETCQGPGAGIGNSLRASESGAGGGNLPTTIPAPAGNGVMGFTAHSVSVRHKVKGSSVTVSVSAPAAGRVAVSGAGVGTVSRSAGRAGVYRLKVSLTAHQRKRLKQGKRVKVRLRVTFTSSSGARSATSTTVTFT